MESDDQTLEILRGIREAVDDVGRRVDDNGRRIDENTRRLDENTQRLDEHSQHLAQNTSRLERVENRQVESEIRLSSELVALAGAVNEVRDLLRADLVLRRRVDDHERRLLGLEQAGSS